jgi:hypothetical protein
MGKTIFDLTDEELWQFEKITRPTDILKYLISDKERYLHKLPFNSISLFDRSPLTIPEKTFLKTKYDLPESSTKIFSNIGYQEALGEDELLLYNKTQIEKMNKYKLTISDISNKLNEIIENFSKIKTKGHDFYIGRKFGGFLLEDKIKINDKEYGINIYDNYEDSHLYCPFLAFEKENFHVKNKTFVINESSDDYLKFTTMTPHLLEEHSFFGGKNQQYGEKFSISVDVDKVYKIFFE